MRITARRARWITRICVPILRVLGATWRIRFSGYDLDYFKPDYIIAFLHGDMLIAALLHRKVPAAVLISQHRDGEIIAQIVKGLGPQVPIRGSSSRGGAQALKEMLGKMQNRPWAVTPDGPRGPRGSVHDGVILLAGHSGRPIIPAGFAASKAKHLRSWDRFVVPAPFARIASFLGEPMRVPVNVDRDTCRKNALELEERLQSAKQEAHLILRN